MKAAHTTDQLIELAESLKKAGHGDPVIAAIVLGSAVLSHADQVRLVAHGSSSAPSGLEMVAMAIAGENLGAPLGNSVARVADALEHEE